MQDFRNVGTAALFYLAMIAGVAGVATAGGYVGMTALASVSESSAASPSNERTRLDQVVANAREIKASLNKPQPALEPLGPIVNRRPHTGTAKMVVTPKPKLAAETTQAFAGDWSQPQRDTAPTYSYRAYDRHRAQ